MSKILVLEDDKLFNETLEDFLEDEGYDVTCVLDPYSAMDLTYENNYDIYLFDVNLPYESGFELLSKLREGGDTTPCIFITSRDDKNSLKDGFGVGGDDYITKPIDLDELSLRVEAVLRRQVRSSFVKIGEYSFDISTRVLYRDGNVVDLSVKSGELLLVLLEGKEQVVTFAHIKDKLWSYAEEASDGSLRVYITQLKKYFPTQIKNVRGVGYQMSLS